MRLAFGDTTFTSFRSEERFAVWHDFMGEEILWERRNPPSQENGPGGPKLVPVSGPLDAASPTGRSWVGADVARLFTATKGARDRPGHGRDWGNAELVEDQIQELSSGEESPGRSAATPVEEVGVSPGEEEKVDTSFSAQELITDRSCSFGDRHWCENSIV